MKFTEDPRMKAARKSLASASPASAIGVKASIALEHLESILVRSLHVSLILLFVGRHSC